MNTQRGNILVTGILAMSLVLSLIFGVWSFAGMQDNKNNVAKKVAAAEEEQADKTAAEKDAEYAEKEKSPVKNFVGPDTYGSVSVDHPKTWSVYSDGGGNTPVNMYFAPNFVSSSKDSINSLRIQVIESSYNQEVAKYDDDIKKGKLTATAFRATKAPDTLGVRLDGQIASGKTGAMIILPLRDKTIRIWTEAEDFLNDFNAFVVPSLSFVP
jgi:hypothetical protein